jgi:hypothetical protein
MLRITRLSLATMASLTLAVSVLAQAPAGAPSGTTGLCKDGSYTSTATKKGACHGHKGVQAWYGPATSTRTASAEPSSSGSSASAPAPSEPPASSHAMAAGGGAGQVWANTDSKVYHCPGDRYYGKTKNGTYMSEADAKAQGYRPDHGKVCTQ